MRPVRCATLERQLVAEAGSAEVSHLPATVPAPSLAEIVEMFSSRPGKDAVAELRRQQAADPESGSFTPDAFAEVAQRLTRGGSSGDSADGVVELRPDGVGLLDVQVHGARLEAGSGAGRKRHRL